MASKKGNPTRVCSSLATSALDEAKGDRQSAWSQYIILHYRATGNLAPGCDMADLQALYDEQQVPWPTKKDRRR